MRRALATTRHRIYLLTTRTARERTVQRRLRDLGVKSYTPALLEYRTGGPVEVLLFPRYLFVWVYDEWEKIRCVEDAGRFVEFGDGPAQVNAKVVRKLRGCEGPTGYVRLEQFFDGQVLHMLGGTAPCVCLGYDQPGNRVRVLMQILGGREVELTVPESSLVAA